MQQNESAEKPKIEMPEIIFDHESWGTKLLRSFLPKDWKVWIGILGDVGEVGVIVKIAQVNHIDLLTWPGLAFLTLTYWLVGSVVTFLAESYVTVQARKSEKNIVAKLGGAVDLINSSNHAR